MKTKQPKRAWKWPESAPFLTPDDICHREMYGPNETHCLIGWKVEVMGFRDIGGFKLYRAIRRAGRIAAGQIGMYNDDPKNSKAKIAEVWNKAMRLLGYRRRGNIFVKAKR